MIPTKDLRTVGVDEPAREPCLAAKLGGWGAHASLVSGAASLLSWAVEQETAPALEGAMAAGGLVGTDPFTFAIVVAGRFAGAVAVPLLVLGLAAMWMAGLLVMVGVGTEPAGEASWRPAMAGRLERVARTQRRQALRAPSTDEAVALMSLSMDNAAAAKRLRGRRR